MPRTSTKATVSKNERASLYDRITERIIAELEEGRLPWVRPWKDGSGGMCTAMPRNAITRRPYSGINILLLWAAMDEQGFVQPAWLTYRQAQAMGGQVRKDERGTMVVFANRFTPEGEQERAERDGDEARSIPFLRSYTVFNVAQCDGIGREAVDTATPLDDDLVDPTVQAIIDNSQVRFRIGGNQAFYAPAGDYIAVPAPQAFHNPIDWHRTALHELAHATGHKSRLGRDLTGAFGSENYAREELVAELAAAFTCASLGIEPTVRHANYIGSWLDVLKNDNRAIIRAASQASKAADWILSKQPARSDGVAIHPHLCECAA